MLKSAPLLDLASKCLLMLVLLACGLSACAVPISINRPASSCSTLVPDSWRAGVAGADLPAGQTVGDWIAFGDAQTGKLDVANDRTRSTLAIVERCEARDAETVKALTPRPWWKLWPSRQP